LKIVCSTVATVTIHSRAGPYWITAAGPSSHSPLPMETLSRMALTPIIFRKLLKVKGGGAGSSETSIGGPKPTRTFSAPESLPGLDMLHPPSGYF